MNTKNTENHFLHTFKHFVSLQILNSQKTTNVQIKKGTIFAFISTNAMRRWLEIK